MDFKFINKIKHSKSIFVLINKYISMILNKLFFNNPPPLLNVANFMFIKRENKILMLYILLSIFVLELLNKIKSLKLLMAPYN